MCSYISRTVPIESLSAGAGTDARHATDSSLARLHGQASCMQATQEKSLGGLHSGPACDSPLA